LHALLCRVHYAKGELGHAVQEADAALRINPKYGLALLYRAALDLLGPDPTLGVIGMVEAVTTDRRLETDLFQEALAAADAGDFEAAAQRAFSVRPARTMVDQLLQQGDEAMRRKEFEPAATAYAEASALAPSFADVQARHGQALLELGRVEESVAAFQRSVASAPTFAAGHALLGVALRRLGDEDSAKAAFQAALAVDPAEPIARFELGRLPS
jgi:tetratricopeptide (TPR) repeat protein